MASSIEATPAIRWSEATHVAGILAPNHFASRCLRWVLKIRAVLRIILAIPFLSIALAGCATPQAPSAQQPVYDPLEHLNRDAFKHYLVLDRLLFRPAAQTYRNALPEGARHSLGNFLNNVSSLKVFANDVLRGRVDDAGTTLLRTVINSSVGVVGFFDVADDWGLKGHSNDFGKTLAANGVGEGPYLFFPLLGPGNLRDFAGSIVDLLLNPFIFLGAPGAYIAIPTDFTLSALDKREKQIDALDQLKQSSLDFYVTVRDGYTQSRRSEIRQDLGVQEPAPEF
jgi:phospholipid-binding lipoprotein MlaA